MGMALLQGLRLPLLTTLGTGLSPAFKGPDRVLLPSTPSDLSSALPRIQPLYKYNLPFSLPLSNMLFLLPECLSYPVPLYTSVGHPSLHLGLRCLWSTRSLRGSCPTVQGTRH